MQEIIGSDGKIYRVVEKKPKKKTPHFTLLFLFFVMGAFHPMGGVIVLGFWILAMFETRRTNKKNGY